MKKKSINKLVSVLAVTTILGTSAVTPLQVLTTPVQAAISATAPKYVAPSTPTNFTRTKINAYFPEVTFNANSSTVAIDMTKIARGYGVSIYHTFGGYYTYYKQTAAGVKEYAYINVGSMNRSIDGNLYMDLIKADGTSYLNAAYSFVLDTRGYYQYSTAFGQAVYNLFKDASLKTLGSEVTQADIDIAKNVAKGTSDSPEKIRLENLIEEAQSKLDNGANDTEKQDKAREAVNNLFENKDPKGDITTGVTQEDLTNAQNLVNQVADEAKKAALQTDLDKAKAQLAEKEAQAQAEKEAEDKAREAVNNLFENKDPKGDITTGLTQEDITNAQKLVDEVTDANKKAELQADLDKAKTQLAEQGAQAEKEAQDKAREAVNNLFENKNPKENITTGLTQEDITNAQKLVDNVTDSGKKAELQADLDKAQSQLNAQQATNGTITTTSFAVGVDKYITGTYTGDVARISMIQDGVEFTGASVKNGAYSFYATDKKIKKDQTIIMVAYDKYGKELAREQVKFIVATEGKITPAEMTIPGDRNITGTYTGDVAKIEVTVNGKVYRGGTVANGTFQFYSLDKVTKTSDVVTITAFDSVGKLLDTKTVKIKTTTPAGGTIKTDTYTLGDKNITGTYTGETKSVTVTVNGTPYKGGTFNTDGTFKFYALDKITSADDIVVIQAFDKTGKVLNTQTITVSPK